MNEFEKSILKRIGEEKFSRVQNAKIGVIGCGGLGSNMTVCLVRSGFKRFMLMDFDSVDFSNLNRQYYFYDDVGKPKADVLRQRLLAVNPDLEITVYKEKLNKENINYFKSADVLAECVDIAETKAEIVGFGAVNKLFTVSSSGMAGYGDAEEMTVKKMGNVYITGDFKSGISSVMHPYAPKVAIAAALEADVILKYIMDGE